MKPLSTLIGTRLSQIDREVECPKCSSKEVEKRSSPLPVRGGETQLLALQEVRVDVGMGVNL